MLQLGPDHHFGLCRSYYYGLERAGIIRLARPRRRPGQLRSKVLVPYKEVLTWIERGHHTVLPKPSVTSDETETEVVS
ncbi:MAG: hypothetical protein NVV63_02255 [Opitutus sp.]|nr:hypothetical protein [Opitutus sp.]